jgi:hypothetical protein
VAETAQLHEQIDCYAQGGRSYYRCKSCGKDFVSFRQGMDVSGWLGHRINRRYEEHVREHHSQVQTPSDPH